MNILVIPPSLPTEQADYQNSFIWDYISSTKPHHNVEVLIPVWTGAKGVSVSNEHGIELTRVTLLPDLMRPLLRRIAQLIWFTKIEKLSNRFQHIDLIHAHGLVIQGYPALKLARGLGIPICVSIHGDPNKIIRQKRLKRFAAHVLAEADCVFVVSEHQKQQLLSTGIQCRRIEVTNNPVSTQLFKPSYTSTKYRRFVFVGRLEPYKGAYRTLDAFSRIQNKHPHWSLTIVGTGPDQTRIKRFLADHSSLASKVDLIPNAGKNDVARIMRQSSVLVHPTTREAFGLVVSEAMSSGLPIITSNSTGAREQMLEFTGKLVDPLNIDEIAQAMSEIVLRYDEFDSNKIRQHVISRYSFEVFGQRLDHLYHSLFRA